LQVECEFGGLSFEEPNCVVMGDCAEHFTYANMNKAFRVLVTMQKPLLYSLGKGRYFKEDMATWCSTSARTQ
jgi:phospholysine phosphohistidine inorganic pyrophosphate phosphatase